MFRSKNYYDHEGFLYFVGEALSFIFGVLAFLAAAIAVIAAVATGLIWIFAGPECIAKGEKMNVRVEWAFHSGCMINIKDQWLPWGEVVPVEKDGKITFTPKANAK